MKTLTLIFLFGIAFFNTLNAQELGDFRWQYRIILLMDPEGSPECDKQLQSLKAQRAALQERDVLLFVFNGKSLLDEQGKLTPLGIKGVPNPTFKGLILIGKDGSVKLKKPFPVAPEFIFERIDAMPMRQSEMRDGR